MASSLEGWGKAPARARERAGPSQEVAAKAIGVSRVPLSDHEVDEAAPSRDRGGSGQPLRPVGRRRCRWV